MPEARNLQAADLRAGLQADFERDITADDVRAFAGLSGDWNPLHSDEAYARHTNYGECIVHGAFQVGLASAMAGMYLPGRNVVVGSFQCRFPAPLPYPSRVRVVGEITLWAPQTASGTLRVGVTDLAAGVLTAEIYVSFSLHEGRAALVPAAEASAQDDADSKPLVLITGASGGLGRNLVSALLEHYQVIGLSRTRPDNAAGAEWISTDLAGDEWEQQAGNHLRGRALHGVVHAAWPAGPAGSLLETEPGAVASQVLFGSQTTIRLARFLKAHASSGGRMVILGTTAATIKPVLNMAAYSLGKATLEHTVRLLAPELARAGIAVNMVAPSFVPAGMNGAKTNRVVLTETAKVPMGRLCAPEDVSGAVRFFLSPGAAFVTGQILPLTGGQL